MADIAFSSVGKIIKVAGQIKEAVDTVKRNKEECEDIKSCVARVEEILGQLDQTAMNPAMSGALEDLAKSVDKALELVNKCQQKHIISHLWGANSMAKKLNKVHEDIGRKLQMGNFAAHVSVYNTLHPQDAGAGTISRGQSTSVARSQGKGKEKEQVVEAANYKASSSPSQVTTKVAYSKSTPARDKKPKYNVRTRDQLLTLMKQEAFEIAQFLKVPEGVAELLLHHYHWAHKKVKDEWSTNREAVCKAVGLRSSDEIPISMKLSAGFGTCKLCDKDLFNRISPGSCEHYYCESCWRDYFSRQMTGPGWKRLLMRCPDPSCQAVIVRELVEKTADEADKDLYDRRALHSWYTEKMAYAGRLSRWCPGDCGRAIDIRVGDDDGADVVCDCGHSFKL